MIVMVRPRRDRREELDEWVDALLRLERARIKAGGTGTPTMKSRKREPDVSPEDVLARLRMLDHEVEVHIDDIEDEDG